jgi:6-phosphogluconolactonase (cycloisomerase 2 family)
VNGIQVSTLDTTTGTLSSPISAIPFNDFENQGEPAVVTPSGKFLYEEGFFQSPPQGPPFYGTPTNAIWGYQITGADGSLTSLPAMPVPQNDTGLGFTPGGLVMDHQGKFLFTSVNNSNAPPSIWTFSIDQSTGALTNTSTLSPMSATWLIAQAVDPSNKYLYCADYSNNLSISVFSIAADGSLAEISGSPFAVYTLPIGLQYNLGVIPYGSFVYATTTNGNSAPGVFSFSVDPATNALTLVPGSPFIVGSSESIELGTTGNLLFVTSPGANVSVFAVNSLLGTIGSTPVSSTPIANYYGETLVDPSGQFLVLNDGYNTASNFKIDNATGALTLVAGSPFTVGAQWETAFIVRIP